MIESTPSNESNQVEEKRCYICWEGDHDELGTLKRDCGCRNDNGYAHTSCLVTAMKTRNKEDCFEALTQSWLTCNQCQIKYAEPTKSILLRELNGNRAMASKLISSICRMSIALPYSFLFYTILVVVLVLCFALAISAAFPIITILAHFAKSFRRSSAGAQVAFAVVGAGLAAFTAFRSRERLIITSKTIFRHTSRYIFLKLLLEGEFGNIIQLPDSVWLGSSIALSCLACMRINEKGTYDYPFFGFRPALRGSWPRKVCSLLSYYAKELGYWAFFTVACYAIFSSLVLGGYCYIGLVCYVVEACWPTMPIYSEPITLDFKQIIDRFSEEFLTGDIFTEFKHLAGEVGTKIQMRHAELGAEKLPMVELWEPVKEGFRQWWYSM